MLYVWIISLIFYRYTFFVFKANDLAPPYWSTWSGRHLHACRHHADCQCAGVAAADITDAIPRGIDLALLGNRDVVDSHALDPGRLAARLQALSTALRPALLGSGLPLGMYTACTIRVSKTIPDTGFLIALPKVLSSSPWRRG